VCEWLFKMKKNAHCTTLHFTTLHLLPVVGSRNRAEALLASCVPNLKPHPLLCAIWTNAYIDKTHTNPLPLPLSLTHTYTLHTFPSISIVLILKSMPMVVMNEGVNYVCVYVYAAYVMMRQYKHKCTSHFTLSHTHLLVGESQQQAALAHAAVSDEQQLDEEVVALAGHFM
jgi:hypothetical protein